MPDSPLRLRLEQSLSGRLGKVGPIPLVLQVCAHARHESMVAAVLLLLLSAQINTLRCVIPLIEVKVTIVYITYIPKSSALLHSYNSSVLHAPTHTEAQNKWGRRGTHYAIIASALSISPY